MVEITICKNDDDVAMFLKSLISRSLLYDSHSLQEGRKDEIQICSSIVSVLESKHTVKHDLRFKLCIKTVFPTSVDDLI